MTGKTTNRMLIMAIITSLQEMSFSLTMAMAHSAKSGDIQAFQPLTGHGAH
jgi:hypothetical protein